MTSAATLRVVDFDVLELAAVVADSTGTANLQTNPLAQEHIMRVERIVVQGTNTGTPQVVVYAGDSAIRQHGRDWTPLPPGAVGVAEYPVFLTIKPTLPLLIQITGANPGERFFASVQYQKVEKVIG